MSSQAPTQILISIPFQIPAQIPANSEDPIVFHVLSPFPYKITKSVPWNYTAIAYVGDKPLVLEPIITNIYGIKGMTQSGRVLSPEHPPNKNTPESSKGKEVVGSGEGPSKKGMPQEEVEEFLRLIRKSDYKVVDQLN